MAPPWVKDAIFYHIYPLGLCDAPPRNDFNAAPVPRLAKLHGWLDHIQALGANAVYLGPVFEATAHGYDTADYFHVDRRLGTRETLQDLVADMKRRGLRVVLDGVFNHVGRDFWAFRDVLAHGQDSAYAGWFAGLDFGGRSPHGDPFTYATWAGHADLVKLNLGHPEVRQHLFDAIRFWVEAFDIDGLRLDAADHMDPAFFRALHDHCRGLKPDFWLMGEVVHGDYTRWANPQMLDATTNYAGYKGLYSSHNDANYFEIAHTLERQSGPGGSYRDLYLYNFADNHDVDRIASQLRDPAHLYPLYGLLFTMPGVPSIYYGSEWGIAGRRSAHSDRALRPALEIMSNGDAPHPDLAPAIRRLAALRHATPALKYGGYRPLHVAPQQLAFARPHQDAAAIVVINAAGDAARVPLQGLSGTRLIDRLNGDEVFAVRDGRAEIDVYGTWLRILEPVA